MHYIEHRRTKPKLKRIQFHHRTIDGHTDKFWQHVDVDRTMTLEHVWKHVQQYLPLLPSHIKRRFVCQKQQRSLPDWYHVDQLNDEDCISIEEHIER
jgi:hypothetical protein